MFTGTTMRRRSMYGYTTRRRSMCTGSLAHPPLHAPLPLPQKRREPKCNSPVRPLPSSPTRGVARGEAGVLGGGCVPGAL